MSKTIQWLSPVPVTCETCDAPIGKVFYDAKTKYGPWACMCPTCFIMGPGLHKVDPGLHKVGPGLHKVGLGLGQEYKKQGGVWIKTAG